MFDTTLRDGEQSPGISLSPADKVRIAAQLESLGVDVIEAGFPSASANEVHAVHSVAANVATSSVAALARTVPRDIDIALQALSLAKRPRIHTFIATSDVHMKSKLRMSHSDVVAAAHGAVDRAKRSVPDVQFSCEDATRSDPAFLSQVFSAAADAGATTLNLPDTVGYALPEEFGTLFSFLKAEVDREVSWSVHTHDDLGLAVANALAGICAGADQVEVAVNGIGERAGNCALEEIVMALRTRHATTLVTGLRCTELVKTSRLVADLTGYPVPANKAIVGGNAFAHEAGIHQHGMLADRTTYEIIDPLDVGADGSRLVLGKHSGRHAFMNAIAQLGLRVNAAEGDRAFLRFKEITSRKGLISDLELRDIVLRDEFVPQEGVLG